MMWFLIVLCFAVGEFSLLQMLGIQFPPVLTPPIPTTTLLGMYLISRCFVSVAVASKYYKK